MIRKIVFYLFLAASIASCKSGKLQKKGVDLGVKADSTALNEAQFVISKTDFKQIKFKSDVAIESKAFSQKIPLTFHVQKDQMIWATINLGLEIGRAKITQDSLIFLDRFNRKAYMGSWEELTKASGFDLNYNILQSMLLGDMVFPLLPEDKIENKELFWNVTQQRDGLIFVNKVDKAENKLFEIQATNQKHNADLSLEFKSFVTENQKMIPSLITMLLSGSSPAKLEIKHSRIEFLEEGLSFSFTVPANYKIEKLPGI